MERLNDLAVAGGQLKSPGKLLNIATGQLKASRIDGMKMSTIMNGTNNEMIRQNGSKDSTSLYNLSQLIPYPSSAISTSFERPSDSMVDEVDAGQQTIVRRSNKKSSPSRTKANQIRNQASQQVIPIDVEHIVRCLTTKRNVETQTMSYNNHPPVRVNQFVQVNMINEKTTSASDSSIFDLQRSNQTLKSQLDQLGYVVEEMSKERSAIQLHLHSTQKIIGVKELRIQELEAEREKFAASNEESRFLIANLERQVTSFRSQLLEQAEQSNSMRQEMARLELERNQLVDQSNKLKGDNVQKDMIIAKLSSNSTSVNSNSSLALVHEQLGQANAEIKMLSAQRYQLLVQLNQQSYANGCIRTSLANVRSELAQLKQNFLTQAQVVLCQLSELPKHYEAIVRQYKSKIINEFDAFKNLNEAVIKEKLKTIDKLTETISKDRTEMEKMKINIDELGEEVKKLTIEKDDNAARARELDSKLKDFETTVTKQRTLLEESQLRHEMAQSQIASLLQDNENFKIKTSCDSNQTQEQLANLSSQLDAQLKISEALRGENDQLKQDLQTKLEEIASVESNVQLLGKKYRELVQSNLNTETIQDGEVNISTMLDDLGRLQRLFVDKNRLVQAQNDRLVQFEFEQRSLLDKLTLLESMVSQQSQGEKLAEEKETLLKQLESLRKESKRDKERLNGLSESLFNEKKNTKKLQDEVKSITKHANLPRDDKETQTEPRDVVIDISCASSSSPSFTEIDSSLDDLQSEMLQMKQFLLNNLS